MAHHRLISPLAGSVVTSAAVSVATDVTNEVEAIAETVTDDVSYVVDSEYHDL